MSRSTNGPDTWKDNQIKSAATWTREHDVVFDFEADPLIMGLALSSRGFPARNVTCGQQIPGCGNFSLRDPRYNSDRPCLPSIEWTANSSGINSSTPSGRDQTKKKPSIACVLDGLASQTTHFAVFYLSTELFYFDCKLKLVSYTVLKRAMADQSEFENWQSSLKNDFDARMIAKTDRIRLLFESHRLGRAIHTFFFDDPRSADESAYRPFLQLSRIYPGCERSECSMAQDCDRRTQGFASRYSR